MVIDEAGELAMVVEAADELVSEKKMHKSAEEVAEVDTYYV